MFTADMARDNDQDELDQRIKQAVKYSTRRNAAYLRVYIEDPWCNTIKYELERRGFENVKVPDFCLKGDVYFEW